MCSSWARSTRLRRCSPAPTSSCSPRDRESFGLSALEALASGVPVIGHAPAGCRRWSRDGVTGACASVGDVEGMARAAVRPAQDDDAGRARAMRAAADARARFSLGQRRRAVRGTLSALRRRSRADLVILRAATDAAFTSRSRPPHVAVSTRSSSASSRASPSSCPSLHGAPHSRRARAAPRRTRSSSKSFAVHHPARRHPVRRRALLAKFWNIDVFKKLVVAFIPDRHHRRSPSTRWSRATCSAT